MDVLVLAVAGGGAVAAYFRVRDRIRTRRDDKAQAAEELASIRTVAEADAVLLGEELAQLDARTAASELDQDADADYQAALEAYESALQLVDRLESVDDVGRVVDTLAVGRYAVACVLARAEGTPPPKFRVPCFFDPRHGPASTEVRWNRPGRGTRLVPACAQDAARQAAGASPEVQVIRIDGVDVPYWEAGQLSQPFKKGYSPRTVREATLDHRAQYSLYEHPVVWGGGDSPGM
jgi:hypothetical protein